MLKWLFDLLPWVLPQASAPIRDDLVAFAKKFREDARKTPNQADDILANILCELLGVE